MPTSRVRTFISITTMVAGLAAALPLHAQGEVGNVLQSGQVIVKVYATMDQAGLPYGRAIDHFDLLLLSPAGERTTITTDASGGATLELSPGAYRLASSKPLEWLGRYYMWDLPLTVRPGMHAVNLTQQNATGVDASNARAAIASIVAPGGAPASGPVAEGPARVTGTAPPAYLYKSPGVATLFSFLIAGAGQVYNGQVGKGIGLFLVSTAGAAVALSAAAARNTSCDFAGDCSTNSAPILIGGGVFFATWIYSMVDANSTARHHNEQMGFRVGSIPVAPHIGAESNGRTTIGLSLAVR